MEKKKWVKLAGFAMVFLLSLFLCVGCSDMEQDKLVTVGFEPDQESLSRGLGVSLRDSSYRPEDLYWSYTAVKTSGIHTTGETTTEKPVSAGNVKGLSGFPKQFSTGNWTFSIYAYLNATDYAISNATTRANARVFYCTDKAVNLTKSCSVAFQLTNGSKLDAKGYLEIGKLTMKVPEKRDFAANSSVILTITEGSTTIASGTTVLTTGCKGTMGYSVLLDAPTVSKKEWSGTDLKLHTFNVKVEYKANSTAPTERIREGSVQCSFEAGKTTVLNMDLNDLPLAWQRVGGTIFFIKPLTTTTGSKLSMTAITGTADGGFTISNVHYIFFKEDGTPINLNGKTYQRGTSGYTVATDTITPLLEDAYWCTISKQSGFSGTYEDRIFVLDTTNCWVTAMSGHGSSGTSNRGTGVGYGGYGTSIATTYGLPTNKDGIGQGKATYQAVMATKGVSGGAFEKLIDVKGTSSASPNPNVSRNNTIWAYLDFLNNGTSYPVSGYSGDIAWKYNHGYVSAPGGYTDWYCPTPMEFSQLGLWCGALKYSASIPSYVTTAAGTNIDYIYSIPYYGVGPSATKPAGVRGRVFDILTSSFTRLSCETNATASVFLNGSTGKDEKQYCCYFHDDSNGCRDYCNCMAVAIRSM